MRSTINPILAILTGAITAIIGLIIEVVSYALNKHKKRAEEIKES